MNEGARKGHPDHSAVDQDGKLSLMPLIRWGVWVRPSIPPWVNIHGMDQLDPRGIGPKWEGHRDPTQSCLGNLGRGFLDHWR